MFFAGLLALVIGIAALIPAIAALKPDNPARKPTIFACTALVAIAVVVLCCGGWGLSTADKENEVADPGSNKPERNPTENDTRTPTQHPGVDPASTSTGKDSEEKAPVWEGKIRITESGIGLNGIAPNASDPAWSSIRYLPDNNAFSLGNSHGSFWETTTNPAYNQCVESLGTNSMSPDEEDGTPYREGSAFCIHPFGWDNIAFVRIIGKPKSGTVQAFAIIWQKL